MDYEGVIAKLTSWGRSNDAVRLMVLTGSAAAQQSHPLSDRDIEIYVTDPPRFLDDDSWWDQLGEVLVVERLPNPGWHPTRLVYYVGGKLDLAVIDVDALRTVRHERPFTVLLDKDGLARWLSQVAAEVSLPDAAAFDERLNWGYAAALMTAKAIVRDVRFLGSRMRQWMDPEVQKDLELCWGHFDAPDSAAALLCSVALFAKLASRTAEHLGFAPFDHDRLRQEIETILSGN